MGSALGCGKVSSMARATGSMRFARNHVARERQAGTGIDNRRRELGKVADPLPRRRRPGQQDAGGADGFDPSQLFPEEEEHLVAHQRSANRAAKVVILQRRRVLLAVAVQIESPEERRGIELVVAHELEQRAAKLVGTRLGHDVHLPARITAEFGVVVRAQDVDFLDRVDVHVVDERQVRTRHHCCRRRRSSSCSGSRGCR